MCSRAFQLLEEKLPQATQCGTASCIGEIDNYKIWLGFGKEYHHGNVPVHKPFTHNHVIHVFTQLRCLLRGTEIEESPIQLLKILHSLR